MTKAKLRSIIITFMVTVGVCCPLFAGGNPIGKDNQSDSLFTRDHIYEYTFSDTVKAARIINTMRSRKLAPVHVLDIAQGDLLFNNGRYNAALPYYGKALRSDSVKADDDEYMDMLHRMVSCYDCLHDENPVCGQPAPEGRGLRKQGNAIGCPVQHGENGLLPKEQGTWI